MLATQSDSHREWHLNSGVPVGLPCPWDACDPANLDDATLRRLSRVHQINLAHMRGEEGDARIACGECNGIHLAARYVRECYAKARANDAKERLIAHGEDLAAARSDRY